MEKILVSACLLGAKVRYHGGHNRVEHALLEQWAGEGRLVPLCPEVEAGLPVPRAAAELIGLGAGSAVLDREIRVRTKAGADVTEAFVRGAEVALNAVRTHRIKLAILKDGSPSCGSTRIADGSFSGTKVVGKGVTAALLERHRVRVFSETEIELAAAFLAQLEPKKRR